MSDTRTANEIDRDEGHVDEVGDLIVTLLATPSSRVTACRGWTAHELVAHLAAGAAEEADLITAHLDGQAERPTRGFDERELPHRAIPDAELRDRLLEESARLTTALNRLSTRPRDGVLFTGRRMTAADFTMHSRSECALHRWDLVGRDETGWAGLSQPKLTVHALKVLSSMSSLPETPANRIGSARPAPDQRIVLRSAPHDDVVITWSSGGVTLQQSPVGDSAADIELDPAARLLLLWGRREPSAPIDLHAEGEARVLAGKLLGG